MSAGLTGRKKQPSAADQLVETFLDGYTCSVDNSQVTMHVHCNSGQPWGTLE